MATRAGKIDFKQYRTPELYNSIRELLDLRGIYARGFYQVFIVTFLIAVAFGILLITESDKLGMIGCLVMVFVGFEAGIVTGLCYALASLIRQSITNMIRVVDLLLQVAKRVAKDVNAVRSGETEMPSAKEIVRGVYVEVFLPTIEQVISETLWIFGKPILFIYRLTFGQLIRIVIRILPDRTLEMIEGQELEVTAKQTFESLEKIADNETTIVGALDWTQKKLVNIGGKVRILVMLPCYAICVLVVLFHILMVYFTWYLLIRFMVNAQPVTASALLPEVPPLFFVC